MCLKIDAKNPVLMGQASWGFGLVVVVSDGFPLVVRLWLLVPFAGAGSQCFTARDQLWLHGHLIPGVGGVSFSSVLYPMAFGSIDQASTESLILAQDERWRRA